MDKKDLHNYQHTSANHIVNNNHAALFLEMGLGKTVSTLTAVNILIYEILDINNALVIAPKRVAESVWHAEIEKWAHLRHLKVSKIIGSVKQRQAALRVKADIYLLGRDNTAWLCGQYGGSMLPFDMLILDESSSFKNPKSIRFKALRKVQPSFSRVVLLTGTPAPNGLIDLWSQIYLLDRGKRLGKFISQFRENFFTAGQKNGHIVYKYNITKEGEKEIHRLIGDICISMKACDYLELPGVVENSILLEFTPKQQELYDDFEKEQVLELLEPENTEISAVNAAALSNKLLQFANGAVYDEDKNWHVVHNLKIKALEEIIEEANGQPVLIAWTYRHDMYRIAEALKKYNPRELKTDEDIQDWNAKKIQVLMMHPATGGHGLNLQKGGNIVVWFGQTWSLELLQQLNARLNRQGQDEIVNIFKLAIKGTMDERVIKAQAGKARGQEGLMQATKAIMEKYFSLFQK